jgi:hypothetical protein
MRHALTPQANPESENGPFAPVLGESSRPVAGCKRSDIIAQGDISSDAEDRAQHRSP